MKRLAIAAMAVLAVAVPAVQVDAWGNTGHRLIGVAAMRALPDDLPAFLKTPGAVADVGELAREDADETVLGLMMAGIGAEEKNAGSAKGAAS